MLVRRECLFLQHGWRTPPTCVKQLGTLLLTLLQTLSEAVNDSGSFQLLLFSLVLQVLQLLS